MTAPLKVAVIGGGIGGLSAAVGLRQKGFEVDVYEQAPELTEARARRWARPPVTSNHRLRT